VFVIRERLYAHPVYLQSTTNKMQRFLDIFMDEMELASSISSTIAAGSSIGLTIPDAVCTVLCSWWWAEGPPETFRAIYRNKQIEKTLHLVGCTLESYRKHFAFYDVPPLLSILRTRSASHTGRSTPRDSPKLHLPCTR